MPIVNPTARLPLGAAVIPTPAAPSGPAPTAPSVLGAAFRQNNLLPAAAELVSDAIAPTDTSDYLTPDRLIAEIEASPYWNFRDRFYGLRTAGQVARMKEDIDGELADKQALDAAGGLGVAASLLAGVADPTLLIPGVGLSKTAGVGVNAARLAVTAGVEAAASEAILQGAQETRSAAESVIAVGGSAILGGALGAGIGRLLASTPEGMDAARAAIAEVDRLAQAPDLQAAKLGAANDLSAAAVRQIEAEDMRIAGPAERLQPVINPTWLNVGSQLTSSISVEVRSLARDLVEIPTITRGVDEIGGGVSVETRAKVDRDTARITIHGALDDAYSSGAKSAGLTKADMSVAVAAAMRRGDAHAVEAVAAAAGRLRQVVNGLTNRAARLGLYGPEVNSVDDMVAIGSPTYFPRMWDTEQMLMRRDEFIDRLGKAIVSENPEHAAFAREIAGDVHAKMTDPLKPHAGFDPLVATRGPLKERTLKVNDAEFEDFLVNDAEQVLHRFVNYMSAKVNAHEKGLSEKGFEERIFKLQREYDGPIAAAATPAEKRRLVKRRDNDVKAVRLLMQELLGQGPSAAFANTAFGRVVANAQALSYVTILGNHALSSMPDVVRAGMVAGIGGVVRDAGPALMRGLATTFGAKLDDTARSTLLKDVGIAEHVLHSRFLAYSLTEPSMSRTRTARALDWISAGVSRFSGMDAMTQAAKEVAGAGLARRLYAAGTGEPPRDVADVFRRRNVNTMERRKMLAALAEYGEDVGGTVDPHFDRWPNQDLARELRGVMRAELDTVVVTPGAADRPLWALENPAVNTLLQFKSFFLAGNARILNVLAQSSKREAAVQALGMVTMGMAVESLKRLQSGREQPERLNDLLAAGIDRSGVLSYIMEASNIAEALGAPGVYAALGAEGKSSRYAARGLVSTVFGPSLGLVTNAAEMGTAAGRALSPLTEEEDRAAARKALVGRTARMLPGGELPVIKSVLDIWVQPALEDAAK